MTHAIVLVEAERTALPHLGGTLADVEGVAEAYSVTGEWDFVAIVRVPKQENLAEVVTAQIGQLEGVTRTQTMVAFEAFSKHDLEALFSDLALVSRRDKIDVALMCIGGHYTMDRHDAVVAADLIKADTVIPCHYNTFPPVETDVQAFKSDVESQTSSKVVVLEPGETFSP